MDSENKSCGCSCICDPTVARILDQSAMRFNERAGFAHNNAMDNQTLLLSSFQSSAQNTLEEVPVTKLAESFGSLFSILAHKMTGSA
jgi:hypothetical protein